MDYILSTEGHTFPSLLVQVFRTHLDILINVFRSLYILFYNFLLEHYFKSSNNSFILVLLEVQFNLKRQDVELIQSDYAAQTCSRCSNSLTLA